MSETVEIPCLGRPFELGVPYDIRRDQLCLGMALWNAEKLRNMSDTTDLEPKVQIETIEGDVYEQALRTRVRGSLKLSLLAGLVNVSGAAKCFIDFHPEKPIIQATIRMEMLTSHTEYLPLIEKLEGVDLSQIKATHVVNKVSLGCELYLIFYKHVQPNEQDAISECKNLLAKVQCLAQTCQNSSQPVNIALEADDSILCRVFSDFPLPQIPSTYSGAIDIIKRIPTLMKEKCILSPVPINAMLYPIAKLDHRRTIIIRELSDNLIKQIEGAFLNIKTSKCRSFHLKHADSQIFSRFPSLQDQQREYAFLIDEYNEDLVRQLANIVPSVRSGDEDEAKLSELLKRHTSSPFGPRKLPNWVNSKEKELNKLRPLIMKRLHGFEFYTSKNLNDVVLSGQYERVVCLAFNAIGNTDVHLQEMQSYVREGKVSATDCHALEWYDNPQTMKTLMVCIKQFIKLSESCKVDEMFVLTDCCELIDGDKEPYIAEYVDGMPQKINPPSEPGKPYLMCATESTVELTWEKPTINASNIKSYTILYRAKNCQSDEWKQQKTKDNRQGVSVTGLDSKTAYIFKVFAESEDGTGPMSEPSDPIETKPLLPSEPGKPEIKNITSCSAEVTWTKPTSHANLVTHYVVSYCSSFKTTDEKWFQEKTDNNFIKVDGLSPKTSYIFKIRAETEEYPGPDSVNSEPIKTNPILPCKPGKPSATDTQPHSITVEWTKPLNDCNVITHYTVSYSSAFDVWEEKETKDNNTLLQISGLTSNRAYYIKVRAECDDGHGPDSEISDSIQTEPILPGKPGKPHAKNVTHDSVQVEWNKPGTNAEEIRKYELYYCIHSSRKEYDAHQRWMSERTATAQDTSLMVGGLSPRTSYIFKVHALGIDGLGQESDISDPVETTAVCPGKPGKPEASLITHNTIGLRWSKPAINSHVLKHYVVKYCTASDQPDNWKSSKCNFSKSTIVKQDIGKLTPKTMYIFRVHAVGIEPNTVGPESEPSDPITTKPLLPGKPTKLTVAKVTSSTAEIRWNKPNNNSKLITSYNIFACANARSSDSMSQSWEKITQVPGDAKVTLLSNLRPGTAYLVKLCPNSDDGPGLESDPSDLFYTDEMPPGKPGKPYCDHSQVTHSTIRVYWDKPHSEYQSLQFYNVYYKAQKAHDQWSKTRTKTAETTSLLSSLTPKTTYLIKVSAEGHATEGEHSEVSEPITTTAILPGKPGKPEICEIQHDSILLKWEKPKQYCHHAKFYTILYQPRTTDFSPWQEHPVSPDVTSTVVSGLKSKTKYVFKVRAENEDHQGSEGETSNLVTTKAIIPGKPGRPKVRNSTQNSIEIEWSKPHTNASVVASYTVFYSMTNDPLNHWTQYNNGGCQESCTIGDLSPNTRYIFHVCAESPDGVSEKSDFSAPIKTKPLLPGKPGIPQVSNITATTVQVDWIPPDDASLVTSYTISCGMYKQGPINWKLCTANERSTIISNLAAKTKYVFKVRAESDQGSGPESEISEIIVTKSLLPSKPGKPQVSKVTPDSVEVKWSKPDTNPQCVKLYTVMYRAESDPIGQWRVEKTNKAQESLIVNGLSSKTTYIFKVIPESDVGSSPESEQSDPLEIKPITPGKPGRPIIVKVNSHSVHLKWNKPEFGAEDVSNYKIKYCSISDNNQHQWNVCKTADACEEETICKLKPDTQYQFKVQAESESGCGPESYLSNLCRTDLLPLSIRMREISTLVEKKGTLSVYELPFLYDMKTDEKTMLAKCHIGQPHLHRPVKDEKILMVVGATGAGKSTLINGFANYILGVQWEDDFRFKIKESEDVKKSQIYSQTSWITAYTFHPMKGSRTNYTVTVIDTPGFGDTSGIEKDKLVVNQIKEFFSVPGENGIDQIHAIGFVTQASLARLTTTQKYIFHSILAIFGKNIANSFFMLTTFSDGQKPPVLEAVSTAEITYKSFFKFNNSALFAEPKPDSFDKMFWELGMKSFENFFNEFERAEPQSLHLTQEVLHEREHLEAVVEGLQPQIQFGLSKIDELHQEQLVLKEKEAEINANKKFTYEVTLTQQRKIDLTTGTFVTNCLHCNCTCHYPCKIAKDEMKYKCAAMTTHDTNTTCKVCPRKCSWKEHFNNSYRFEVYEQKVNRTEEDLKVRYQSATAGKTKAEGMILSIEQELKDLYDHVMRVIVDAQRSVKRLQEIALKPNPLTEVEYIDLLIESEKLERKPGFMKRIHTYNQLREKAKLLSKMKSDDSATKQMDPKAKAWWQFWKS